MDKHLFCVIFGVYIEFHSTKKISYLIISLLSGSFALFVKNINNLFRLENASNLTNEFLCDNFNKKILLNILLKIVIQKVMCHI